MVKIKKEVKLFLSWLSAFLIKVIQAGVDVIETGVNLIQAIVKKFSHVLKKFVGVFSSLSLRPISRFEIIFGVLGVSLIVISISFSNTPSISEITNTISQQISQLKENASFNKTRLPFEPVMVRIPAGIFLMGSSETEEGRASDEGPQREVTIAVFEMGKYEVTFDEYDEFAIVTGRKLPDDRGWGRGRRPVINVSFDDAQAYTQWLSDKTDKRYRLPTEAEWEYAARAGTQTSYWWGDEIDSNNAQWSKKETVPVGSFKPNAFKLHDTAGNASEWVKDCWHKNYYNAPIDGSAWLNVDNGRCGSRVIRGGSWSRNSYSKGDLRSASRGKNLVAFSDIYTGFRIARDFDL